MGLLPGPALHNRMRSAAVSNELESSVEDYLVAQVEARDGMCEKFVTPGKKGPPDRIVSWAARGRILASIHFVETKRPKGGVLFSWQSRDHIRRRGMGFRVEVCWTREQVDAYIYSCEVAGICPRLKSHD